MDVQPWPYDEPSRVDAVSTRLTALRARIQQLMGVPVAKDDDAAKAEAAAAAAEAARKSQELFDSLKKHVEGGKK